MRGARRAVRGVPERAEVGGWRRAAAGAARRVQRRRAGGARGAASPQPQQQLAGGGGGGDARALPLHRLAAPADDALRAHLQH